MSPTQLTLAQLRKDGYTARVVETDLPARPARKAPSRPWGWERAFWFHMPQHERRLHYHCCWIPCAEFNRQDAEHGKRDDWWLT